jgi:hypothetical protein
MTFIPFSSLNSSKQAEFLSLNSYQLSDFTRFTLKLKLEEQAESGEEKLCDGTFSSLV